MFTCICFLQYPLSYLFPEFTYSFSLPVRHAKTNMIIAPTFSLFVACSSLVWMGLRGGGRKKCTVKKRPGWSTRCMCLLNCGDYPNHPFQTITLEKLGEKKCLLLITAMVGIRCCRGKTLKCKRLLFLRINQGRSNIYICTVMLLELQNGWLANISLRTITIIQTKLCTP